MRVQFFMLAPVVIRVGDLDQRGLGLKLKREGRGKEKGVQGDVLFSYFVFFWYRLKTMKKRGWGQLLSSLSVSLPRIEKGEVEICCFDFSSIARNCYSIPFLGWKSQFFGVEG